MTNICSILPWRNNLTSVLFCMAGELDSGGYTTYQGPVYVRAGEDFSITCTTDAFRFPKWTLNGHSMEGNFALQVIRPKVCQSFHRNLSPTTAYD